MRGGPLAIAAARGEVVDKAAEFWMEAVDGLVATGRTPSDLGLARRSVVGRVREREREMRSGKYELNDDQLAEQQHRELQQQLQEAGREGESRTKLLEKTIPCCAERRSPSPVALACRAARLDARRSCVCECEEPSSVFTSESPLM